MLHLEHIHHFLRLCNKLLVYVISIHSNFHIWTRNNPTEFRLPPSRHIFWTPQESYLQQHTIKGAKENGQSFYPAQSSGLFPSSSFNGARSKAYMWLGLCWGDIKAEMIALRLSFHLDMRWNLDWQLHYCFLLLFCHCKKFGLWSQHYTN